MEFKKNKVGILTLGIHENYGGILQAYALQKFLKKNGYEPVLLNRQSNIFNYKSNRSTIFKRIKDYILQILLHYHYKYSIINDADEINEFVNIYIQPKTKKITNTRGLKKIVKEIGVDAIIVGSDQVWQPKYSKDYTKNLFLDFVNDEIKKITYAASFGGDTWNYPKEKTRELANLLSKFDAVSVREDVAVELSKKIFGVNSIQVLDPTLLLELEDYEELINNKKLPPEQEKYLLTYILDPSVDKEKITKCISSKRKLNVKSVAKIKREYGRTIYGKKRIKYLYPSVEEWLNGFKNADFVLTDSFHGVVFCIIFNKPFIAYGNKERGIARFESLLRKFGLNERLILKSEDINEKLFCENYLLNNEQIKNIIAIEKNKSISYVNKILTLNT